MRCGDNAVSFLWNTHKRCPIPPDGDIFVIYCVLKFHLSCTPHYCIYYVVTAPTVGRNNCVIIAIYVWNKLWLNMAAKHNGIRCWKGNLFRFIETFDSNHLHYTLKPLHNKYYRQHAENSILSAICVQCAHCASNFIAYSNNLFPTTIYSTH